MTARSPFPDGLIHRPLQGPNLADDARDSQSPDLIEQDEAIGGESARAGGEPGCGVGLAAAQAWPRSVVTGALRATEKRTAPVTSGTPHDARPEAELLDPRWLVLGQVHPEDDAKLSRLVVTRATPLP